MNHSTNRTAVRLALPALLAFCAGCNYLENRGNDFLDSFVLTGKAGVGINGELKLGPFSWGMGYWEGYEAGLFGEDGFTVTKNKLFSCPFPLNFPVGTPVLYVLVKGKRFPYPRLKWGGLLFTRFTEIEFFLEKEKRKRYRKSIYHYAIEYEGNSPLPLDGSIPKFLWKRLFAVELDLAFFLGVRVGFNFLEFVDFLLGWFGADILGDDHAGKSQIPTAKSH
ncbi:MAG: hypothetical protein ACYS47_09700 [Planctomycetota bacterium]